VESLTEYLNLINLLLLTTEEQEKENDERNEGQQHSKKKPLFWFRGHSDVRQSLWPSLYRSIHKKHKKYGGLKKHYLELETEQEKEISHFYARRSHAVSKNRPAAGLPFAINARKKIFSLSILQHYTGNTCLLDWSHQAIAGLFFAIEKYFMDSSFSSEKLPCVWFLDPHKLNHNFQFGWEKYFNLEQENDRCRLPTFYDIKKGKQKKYLDVPCAIVPPLHNDRILAQAGTFVSFPVKPIKKTRLPNEYVTEEAEDPTPFLIKPLDSFPISDKFLSYVIIWNPRRISDELIKIGYDSIDFYPELTNRVRVLEKNW
jgi:hypothetical protein